MAYVYTLDSHDVYGPFDSRQAASYWAEAVRLPSYQVIHYVPEYARNYMRQPY